MYDAMCTPGVPRLVSNTEMALHQNSRVTQNYEGLLGGGCLFVCDTVSTLHKSVLKLPCCNVCELNVVVEWP